MAISPWIWMPFSAAQPTTAPDEELERDPRRPVQRQLHRSAAAGHETKQPRRVPGLQGE